MRRAYVEAQAPLRRAVESALHWAAENATIHVPSSSAVQENKWIEGLGIPITSSSAKSRWHGSPRGIVIGFCLNPSEVLEAERNAGVEGIVVVQAHGPVKYVESALSHAPWITAFDVEHLDGEEIGRILEASPPLKVAVDGLSGIAVVNQGLLDNRERWGVVQTFTYFRDHGVTLEPDGLMVEALRNGWGGTGPEDLRKIAVDLNAGKSLRFEKRINMERLQQWLQAK